MISDFSSFNILYITKKVWNVRNLLKYQPIAHTNILNDTFTSGTY